jgi:FtsZ-binding cell division protein ZapB
MDERRIEAALNGLMETLDLAKAEIFRLRRENAQLTAERDMWHEKWTRLRRELGELKWPGMTGVVKALAAGSAGAGEGSE